VNLTLEFDRQQLDAMESLLGDIPGGFNKAIRMSVNETLRGISTDAKRTIGGKSGELNLNVGKVAATFTIVTMTAKGRSGCFRTKDKPISMYEFGAKQLKKGLGVSFKIKKSRGIHRLPHAFVQKFRGHTAVWMRRKYIGGPAHASGSKGEQIKKLYTTSIADYFSNRPVIEEVVNRKAMDRMEKALERSTNAVLARYSS